MTLGDEAWVDAGWVERGAGGWMHGAACVVVLRSKLYEDQVERSN
jgi:hypothetical protein